MISPPTYCWEITRSQVHFSLDNQRPDTNMGLSPSKRVSQTLLDSPEFNSSCDSVFNDCLSLAQYAFPGIKPYQLLSATEQLYNLVFTSVPLISKWVPFPPDRSQVDRAYEDVISRRFSPVQSQVKEDDVVLHRAEFRNFAAEVFADVVVSNAGKEVLKMLPVGFVGIVGVGAVTKANKKMVGAAIGAYALAVATTVYLSLGG